MTSRHWQSKGFVYRVGQEILKTSKPCPDARRRLAQEKAMLTLLQGTDGIPLLKRSGPTGDAGGVLFFFSEDMGTDFNTLWHSLRNHVLTTTEDLAALAAYLVSSVSRE